MLVSNTTKRVPYGRCALVDYLRSLKKQKEKETAIISLLQCLQKTTEIHSDITFVTKGPSTMTVSQIYHHLFRARDDDTLMQDALKKYSPRLDEKVCPGLASEICAVFQNRMKQTVPKLKTSDGFVVHTLGLRGQKEAISDFRKLQDWACEFKMIKQVAVALKKLQSERWYGDEDVSDDWATKVPPTAWGKQIESLDTRAFRSFMNEVGLLESSLARKQIDPSRNCTELELYSSIGHLLYQSAFQAALSVAQESVPAKSKVPLARGTTEGNPQLLLPSALGSQIGTISTFLPDFVGGTTAGSAFSSRITPCSFGEIEQTGKEDDYLKLIVCQRMIIGELHPVAGSWTAGIHVMGSVVRFPVITIQSQSDATYYTSAERYDWGDDLQVVAMLAFAIHLHNLHFLHHSSQSRRMTERENVILPTFPRTGPVLEDVSRDDTEGESENENEDLSDMKPTAADYREFQKFVGSENSSLTELHSSERSMVCLSMDDDGKVVVLKVYLWEMFETIDSHPEICMRVEGISFPILKKAEFGLHIALLFHWHSPLPRIMNEDLQCELALWLQKCIKTLSTERIVHCDIKIENVFRHKGCFYLGDWELACPADEEPLLNERGTYRPAGAYWDGGEYWTPAADSWCAGRMLAMIAGESKGIETEVMHQAVIEGTLEQLLEGSKVVGQIRDLLIGKSVSAET